MKDENKKFVVYKIAHVDSSKSYIGITCDYKRRMRDHFRCCDNTYLHNSICKYGKDAFTHEIIFECNSWLEACREEKKYISMITRESE